MNQNARWKSEKKNTYITFHENPFSRKPQFFHADVQADEHDDAK